VTIWPVRRFGPSAPASRVQLPLDQEKWGVARIVLVGWLLGQKLVVIVTMYFTYKFNRWNTSVLPAAKGWWGVARLGIVWGRRSQNGWSTQTGRCSLCCLKRPPSLLNQSHSFAGSEPRFPFWLASDTDKPNWTARDRSTGRHQGTIVVSHKAFSRYGLTSSPFLLAADTAAACAIAFTRPGFQLLLIPQ
jgi:hypothetical protein